MKIQFAFFTSRTSYGNGVVTSYEVLPMSIEATQFEVVKALLDRLGG